MLQAIVNQLYPNRVQLQLSQDPGPAVGPLVSTAAVPFDPRRDLELYLNGDLATIQSFAYDSPNDQYLLFVNGSVPVDSVVQVVYHIPTAPFLGSLGVLPGFAVVASVASVYDPVLPALGVSVPSANNPTFIFFPLTTNPTGWNVGGWNRGTWGGVQSGTYVVPAIVGWNVGTWSAGGFGEGGLDPLSVAFYALGVNSVRIQCPSANYDSGFVSAVALFGSVSIPDLLPGTSYSTTITAYDPEGNVLQLAGQDMVIPFTIEILALPD